MNPAEVARIVEGRPAAFRVGLVRLEASRRRRAGRAAWAARYGLQLWQLDALYPVPGLPPYRDADAFLAAIAEVSPPGDDEGAA